MTEAKNKIIIEKRKKIRDVRERACWMHSLMMQVGIFSCG